ncbi:unnamed protein product [Calypogeia fissa]
MTCSMLRGHSGRLLLGRHLLPITSNTSAASSSASTAAKLSSHRLNSIAFHNISSISWEPLHRLSIAPTNLSSSSPVIRGRNNLATFACNRGQFGSRESHNLTSSSLAFHSRGVISRRYASAESGGGNGGGIGNRSGGGGGGGGGGRGGEAGDDGRWRILSWYLGLLDTNPILTKAVTSAVLTLIGDVFCQYYLEKAEKLDGKRVAVMTFLGFALVGPTLHFWYSTLSKLVKVGGPAGVGIRLALDQFLFSPTFIATFIGCLMTLEGNPTQIKAKLKQDWWSAVLVNWQIWIPAQIINFWLVPLKLQVAFANFTALFWNAYLSWKSHLQVATPQSLTSEANAS